MNDIRMAEMFSMTYTLSVKADTDRPTLPAVSVEICLGFNTDMQEIGLYNRFVAICNNFDRYRIDMSRRQPTTRYGDSSVHSC